MPNGEFFVFKMLIDIMVDQIGNSCIILVVIKNMKFDLKLGESRIK